MPNLQVTGITFADVKLESKVIAFVTDVFKNCLRLSLSPSVSTVMHTKVSCDIAIVVAFSTREPNNYVCCAAIIFYNTFK